MPYNTTGEVHHAGVGAEADTAALFTSAPPSNIAAAYPDKTLTFRQEGGTQTVSDVAVYADGIRVDEISSKLHRKGTFDHINTSKVGEYIPCEALVATISRLRTEHRGDASAVSAVRAALKEATNATWDSMTSEGIQTLLNAVDARTPAWMAVKEKSEISVFRHAEMEELAKHPKDPSVTYSLRAARAKESRQIWRTKDGVDTNTHLRLRLVTNNGVTALLGLSAANKNSILTLKIQQDAVATLLTSVQRVRIELA
jgi:hypothetical protein